MKETLISVDIETTGVIVGQDNIASIGACVVGNIKDNFYIELKPFTEKYNPESVEICNLSIDYLKKNGVDIIDGLFFFKNWIYKHYNPVLAAFPSPFDMGFINHYFAKYLKSNSIRCIDIQSYAMAVLKTGFYDVTKKQLAKKIKWQGRHTHNALDDSIEQANLFQKLLKIRGRKY